MSRWGRLLKRFHEAANAAQPYTIDEHKHRFSAWAAASAASVKGCRFSVQQGKEILEAAGIKKLLSSPDRLPSPQRIDAVHRQWRNRIVETAKNKGLTFTHGIAAKPLNVYLKAGFVCSGQHDDPRVRALHPPIDSVLLDALCDGDVGGLRAEWNRARRVRWSRFTSEEYEEVIRSIRQAMPNTPLWQIEKHWRGFQ